MYFHSILQNEKFILQAKVREFNPREWKVILIQVTRPVIQFFECIIIPKNLVNAAREQTRAIN